jgi:hypothetical protein
VAEVNVSFAQFFYRVNPDKTVDSICGFCFLASAPANNQADLRAWESTHVCRVWVEQADQGLVTRQQMREL